MGTEKRPRRKLFVDREVQGALLQRVLVQWGVAMLLGFVALLMIEIVGNVGKLSMADHLVALRSKYGLLFLVLLVTIPAVIYDSIKMSHRFAGPVYAIRVALDKLAKGQELPTVSFREGDYWRDVAGSINQISARLDAQRVADPPGDAETNDETDAALTS